MKSQLRLPFYLTFKYLQRGNVWTLLLTSFMMTVAFVNAIFVSALFNGIVVGSNQQIIDTYTGNIYVAPKDGEDYIKNGDMLVANLEDISGVSVASSRTVIPGQLEYKSIHGNWQILAIDPEQESRVTNVADKMIDGQYLNPDDENGIIIGRQIAGGDGVEENAFSFKGAHAGEKVDLILNGQRTQFTIRGIFYTKFLESDKKAYVTKKALTKLIPGVNDNSTMVAIRTANNVSENSTIEKIKASGVTENIFRWDEVAGTMKAVSTSFTSINALMTLVAIMMAAVTVFIVIYVDIVNKRKQIGILRAIGIRPYIIISSYVIMAAVYSIIGVALGTAAYYLILVPYFNTHPFVLPICDAVLHLKYVDYLARAEAVMWVSAFSGLIPASLVVRAKMLNAILGR
ncbi:MAG: FtsX-like permease family protein [Patescibacteria group bacterium]